MDIESTEVEELTEYFTRLYRSEEHLETSARGILVDFMQYQAIPSENIDADELIDALEDNPEEYDWMTFEDEFQSFLEKKLDRYHNGSIANPDLGEDCLKVERHYNLGYISTEITSPDVEEVFMTSVIQFEEPEGDGYAVEVEYLNEEEGLEAIRHLLENGEKEKIDELLHFGLKLNEERALKAYEAVASKDLDLARDLADEITEPDLRESMNNIVAEKSENN